MFRRNQGDVKALLAAGAGAGLATAFSAPVAGAVFVLEELVRRFDTRITITTLCASGSTIVVARVLLGDRTDFHVESLPYPGFGTVPLFLVLGAVTGVMGVAYNHTLLGALAAAERLGRWWSVDVRAVRAPVTGIILATEMTGSFTLLLPMLLACFAAMMVPNLLGNPPIYDSLTRYAVQQRTAQQSGEKKHASGA